jgi:hypothetical protein
VDGSLGVILVRLRRSEECQHPVTEQMGNRPFELMDGLNHSVVGALDDLPPVLGIHLLRQRRRADDIHKDCCDPFPSFQG